MKILMIQMLRAYIDPDVQEGFESLGHRVVVADLAEKKGRDYYHDPDLEKAILELLEREKADVVYSTNFFPIIARKCHDRKIPYLAWHYDTPPQLPTLQDMDYPTNRIFFFNREDCKRYRREGILQARYLPLAVSAERLSKAEPRDAYQSRISFVGNLYHSTWPMLQSSLSEYDKGWTDGLLEAQRQITDTFFIPELLTKERVESLNSSQKGWQADGRQLSYSMASYLTYQDRLTILALLSERFETTLYTTQITAEEAKLLPHVTVRNAVDYRTQMPAVFRSSKINLCPILRNNTGGVPLRVLDIMGCGGVVLANWQSGLAEMFENGVELLLYRTPQEALDLAEYYLANDEQRLKIGANALERMKRDFCYEDRLRIMLREL